MQGKFERRQSRRSFSGKTVALLMALVLVVGGAVGGTLAWLTDETSEVKNTFSPSTIDITLTESDTDPNTAGDQHDYQMIPGYTITKDPKVTVEEGSEKCWLFVKVEKSTNFDTYMTYAMADGWTQLTYTDDEGDTQNVAGVYYRGPVDVSDDTSTDGLGFAVIKDNTVTVQSTVTKEQMDVLDTEESYPTLTVTAYASQYNKNATETFSAYEAWLNISGDAGATE